MGIIGSKRNVRSEGDMMGTNLQAQNNLSLNDTTRHQRRRTAADLETEISEIYRSGKTTPQNSNRTLKSWRTASTHASFRLLNRLSSKRPSNRLADDPDVGLSRAVIGKETTLKEEVGGYESSYFVDEDNPFRKTDKERARVIFLDALTKSKLMSNTSKTLKEELFTHAAVAVFVNEGDILFDQGAIGHLLFVLVEGKFEAVTINNKGKRRLKTLKSGQAVGEHCVLMNSPHDYTLEASTNGMVLAVHRVQYQMTAVLVADRERLERKLDGKLDPNGDMDDSELNLSSIPLLAPLTPQQLESINSGLVEIRYQANQRIVASKQIVPGLFIVKSGQVAVRAPRTTEQSSNGGGWGLPRLRATMETQLFTEAEHDEIEWLTRGDYFGEASLLSDDAQLGVDIFCSSEKGVSLLLLKSSDWRRILKSTVGESGVQPFTETIKLIHVNRLMNRSSVFSNLQEDQIKELSKKVEFKTFKAGERIVEGGNVVTPEGGMYLITQGAVRLNPFHGLIKSKSLQEIEKRAQLLKDNSKALVSRRMQQSQGGLTGASAEPSNTKPQAASGSFADDARVRELAKGGSFMGLSPRLFGRQMSFNPMMSGGDGAPVLDQSEGAAPLTTSVDHEVLFASLGVSERDYVILLDGELFGEEGIKEKEKDRVAKATVFAIGKVTAAYISLPLLQELEIADLVRQAAFEESDEPKITHIGAQGASTSATEESLLRLDNAKVISKKFLNDEKMKVEELKAQHKSLKATMPNMPRRISTTFKLTAKRLFEVKRLHHTDVVNVSLSIHDPSYQFLVVKELDVAAANKQGMGTYILAEQVVLAQVSSSFVANMISSWEEPERLYLGLEPALVGDLGNLLHMTQGCPNGNEFCPKKGELGGFNFEEMQFIAACGVLALKHLYEHHIIHRDIKPNNIVVDHTGYCKLVDFGIAKRLPPGSLRTYSLCGSPKFMSPELVTLAFKGSGNPYTNAVDWWAFGITLFELATGTLPYVTKESEKEQKSVRDRNEEALIKVDAFRREVHQATVAATLLSSAEDFSVYDSHIWFEPFRTSTNKQWNDFGRFIAKLLNPDPDTRLGSSTSKRGPREAMDQNVFSGLKFERIAQKKHIAPFIPDRFMVDPKDVEKQQRAGKFPPITEHNLKGKSTSTAASDRPKRPGMLKRTTNVESRVRANLEHPDTNNEKMNEAFSNTDQARKQMIMAREQHIRRVAFKQGHALDELDTMTGSRRNHNLVLLQRAAVLETLQVFVESGGSTRVRRILAATRIQAYWRGHHARMLLQKSIKAIGVIHRFYRIVRTKRNDRISLRNGQSSAAAQDSLPNSQ